MAHKLGLTEKKRFLSGKFHSDNLNVYAASFGLSVHGDIGLDSKSKKEILRKESDRKSKKLDGFCLDAVFTLMIAKENVHKRLSFAQDSTTQTPIYDAMSIFLEPGDENLFGPPCSTQYTHGVPRCVMINPKISREKSYAVTWQQRRTIKSGGHRYM